MMNSMLEYKGYHASVAFDAEDNLFIGEVYGVADSLNFHGTSVEELKEMFKQSIDNYLDLCEKIGKSPDKEYQDTFHVTVSPEMYRQAVSQAARQNITLTQYVIKAIAQSLNNPI